MTTEPRPVVPGMDELLRKRLIDLMARDPQFVSFTLAADVARVDAILAEIAAAGFSLVATDRVERLRMASLVAWNQVKLGPLVPTFPGPHHISYPAIDALQPGDLDPLAGGDR